MILDYGDIKQRVLVDSREGEQIRESSNEENILKKRPKAMEEPATCRQYLEE